MRLPILGCGLLVVLSGICLSRGQDKVALDPPATQPAANDQKSDSNSNLAEELKSLPDGVLRVKTNPDGSFKSLVVKATVEIEDVLGGEKGKRLARRDAEAACKRELAQWLDDNCTFVHASDDTVSIVTKGNETKDAAGNTVKLREQEGKEFKADSDNELSVSHAVLRGLIVLQTEVTAGANPDYVLVEGMSQQTLNQAAAVRAALSSSSGDSSSGQSNGGTSASGSSQSPSSSGANNDQPAADTKTNPDGAGF